MKTPERIATANSPISSWIPSHPIGPPYNPRRAGSWLRIHASASAFGSPPRAGVDAA